MLGTGISVLQGDQDALIQMFMVYFQQQLSMQSFVFRLFISMFAPSCAEETWKFSTSWGKGMPQDEVQSEG